MRRVYSIRQALVKVSSLTAAAVSTDKSASAIARVLINGMSSTVVETAAIAIMESLVDIALFMGDAVGDAVGDAEGDGRVELLSGGVVVFAGGVTLLLLLEPFVCGVISFVAESANECNGIADALLSSSSIMLLSLRLR